MPSGALVPVLAQLGTQMLVIHVKRRAAGSVVLQPLRLSFLLFPAGILQGTLPASRAVLQFDVGLPNFVVGRLVVAQVERFAAWCGELSFLGRLEDGEHL